MHCKFHMGRLHFYNHTEMPYHITARCINRDWFSIEMPIVWEIMTRQLYFVNYAFNLRIHGFVLMSNHYHLIVRSPEGNLSPAIGYFMRESSRELTRLSHRINQTYGGRFHRTLLTDQIHYLHAYKYLFRNPVEAGLCSKVEDYEFSSLKGVLGEKWMDIPITEDDNWENLTSREKTLEWLNQEPPQEHWEQVRKALRKPVFKFPKIDCRKSPLENTAL